MLSFPFLPFLEGALIDTLHTAEILMKEMLNHLHIHGHYAWNKLEGDVGDIVSLNAQTSPYFKLREKFKCIEHIDKRETQLKTSPETRNLNKTYPSLRCWVNFQCRGVLLVWMIVGQGPIALAVGVGGGCLDIFSFIYLVSFLLPLFGRRPDID